MQIIIITIYNNLHMFDLPKINEGNRKHTTGILI